MDIMDEESFPKINACEQPTLEAKTVASKEDHLRDLKEAGRDKAAACDVDAPPVTQRNFRGISEELTEDGWMQQGDAYEVIKRRKVSCVCSQVLPQNCNYAKNCPYVPMNVEEVSVVKSLKLWTNPNVRVIGKFVLIDSNFSLCGIGEDQGEICLNVENLDQYPKHGDIVEIFGSLYIYENAQNWMGKPASQIKLTVMFSRTLIDVQMYKKGLSLVKPFIPLFVRRN